MKTTLKTFGARVRELRRANNISQEKLAELASLHRTYIGAIERGERNLSLYNIVKIARALGISVMELFNDI